MALHALWYYFVLLGCSLNTGLAAAKGWIPVTTTMTFHRPILLVEERTTAAIIVVLVEGKNGNSNINVKSNVDDDAKATIMLQQSPLLI